MDFKTKERILAFDTLLLNQKALNERVLLIQLNTN